MVKRQIAGKVTELAEKFPVVAVSGPRQSGKTTLVKEVFKDYKYANLEDIGERDFAKSDPKGFLGQGDCLVIDEVQRVPELFSYIQVLVDENPDKKIVVSGSQNFLLNEKICQTLSGRVAKFVLLPFSVSELKGTDYWVGDYKKYLLDGLYPRLYDRQLKADEWYPNYVETYVERDVRGLLSISDKDQFIEFVISCAANVGGEVNYSDLAGSVGISPNTARSWLSILGQSYLTFRLRPYYENAKKQVRKQAKLYFYDTGLLCYLLGIEGWDSLRKHYLWGKIFENFALMEMVKQDFNDYRHGRFYFLRNKTGEEVDVMYKKGSKIKLVEIKAGETIQKGVGESLKNYNQELFNKRADSLVLYAGEKSQTRSDFKVLGWKDWSEGMV